MNEGITVGGLLLSVGVLAGIVMMLFGAIAFFAEGMSDAPESVDTAKQGCILLIAGIVLLIGCVVGLVR